MQKRAYSDRKSKTLIKALRILEAFRGDQSERGVRSLAAQLSMSPTTVHRILVTYTEFNYLTKDPESNKYKLGPSILKVASSYRQHNPLFALVNQVFIKYTPEWPYTFCLGILNEFELIYVSIVNGSGSIKVDVKPGERAGGLHSTALGKTFLAFHPDNFIKEYIEKVGLEKYTSTTITDPDVLWKQIQEIRRNGFSTNYGEQNENISAIGAPIFNAPNEVIAAFSIAYPMLETKGRHTRLEKMIALTKEIYEDIALLNSGSVNS